MGPTEIVLTVDPHGFVLFAELVLLRLTGRLIGSISRSEINDQSVRGLIISWSYSKSCLSELSLNLDKFV